MWAQTAITNTRKRIAATSPHTPKGANENSSIKVARPMIIPIILDMVIDDTIPRIAVSFRGGLVSPVPLAQVAPGAEGLEIVLGREATP